MLKASIISAAIVALMACTTSDEKLPQLYEGCCGIEPVKFDFGGNLIFIPNLFTPNGDGINDLFKPFFTESKITVETMIIKSPEEGNSVLFTMSESDLSNPQWGWHGYVAVETAHQGKFLYEIVFRNLATNEKKTIIGSCCSAVCKGTEKLPIENVATKCFFPSQYYKGDVGDPSPINYELECLRN